MRLIGGHSKSLVSIPVDHVLANIMVVLYTNTAVKNTSAARAPISCPQKKKKKYIWSVHTSAHSQLCGVRVTRPDVFILDVIPATIDVEPVCSLSRVSARTPQQHTGRWVWGGGG